MGQLTLIVGGVRSGKSRLAEQLAATWPPVTYVATAQAGDAEMARRIAMHRQRRPADWATVEEPWNVTQLVGELGKPGAGQGGQPGCVLVDCLTMWLSNLLGGLPGRPARDEADILAEVDGLAGTVRQGARRVLVVSHEVGCGILPANVLARRFGDLLGEANQRLAAAAGEVHACLVGIPVRLK
jgi:adenosylcobinamide kinase/adenosylcobinamide-phosphate guanylyltransferase